MRLHVCRQTDPHLSVFILIVCTSESLMASMVADSLQPRALADNVANHTMSMSHSNA